MASFEDYMLPCLNKKLFGIECMGCGLQRSISLILHGELKEAFFYVPSGLQPYCSLWRYNFFIF